MGTQAVSEVIWRARQLIHDTAGARWVDAEMLKWFNDGMAEMVLLKPSCNTKRVTLTLVAGTVQQLPAGAVQLIRITHNTSGGAPVRPIDQDRLDAAAPGWRAMAATVVVDHYMYDPSVPTEYQVYPPNTGAGSLQAAVGMEFTRVDAIGTPIPPQDIYIPALTDYLLYRAYSKHSKFAGNEQRALAAYTRFAQALGVKLTQEQALDPNKTNKNQNPPGVE